MYIVVRNPERGREGLSPIGVTIEGSTITHGIIRSDALMFGDRKSAYKFLAHACNHLPFAPGYSGTLMVEEL